METAAFQELHLEGILECSSRLKFLLSILTFLLRKRYPKIYRELFFPPPAMPVLL